MRIARTGAIAAALAITGSAAWVAVPAAAVPLSPILINEIEADGGIPDDWIELVNPSSGAADVSGFVVKDDDDAHAYVIPDATSIPAGGYLVIEKDQLGFGLGKSGDAVRLFGPDGTSVIDSYTWTAQTDTSVGRCPDASGAFSETTAVSKGAANDCSTPSGPSSPNLVINEVESNGDDTDWVEIMNLGSADADISGFVFKDDNDSHAYVLPSGSVVAAGGLFVIDQKTSTSDGFDFGLGNPDEPRLFVADGTTLVASYAYADHAVVTWARCPDGTGEFADATASTKGAPNDCSVPVQINEVESKDGDPGDWVELVNSGAASIDVGGYVVKDDDDAHAYVIPSPTVLAPGAYLVIGEDALGFGFGGADAARLFKPDGSTLVDSHSWTAHATTTYGRCPDASGTFAPTAAPTKGAINDCAGFVTPQPWPGGSSVAAVDAEPDFTGDLSGIDFDPTTGDIWAVENGNGMLYRLVHDASGAWNLAPGWESGKALHYPGGGGTVDAEGVTVTSAGASAGVYVSSERNNDNGSVSRPAVLKYDVGAAGASLTASAEWNLATDFPGLGANKGLEGVTWVSDAFLTSRSFRDEHTGSAYNPSAYPGHGSGLFIVAVEGTASMYAYALMPGGTFRRIATIPTTDMSWASMADVQFDAERGTLFAVCDDVCGGQIAEYTIQSGSFATTALYARPAGMANVANEGFAIADASFCTPGGVPTFYADDADTDGFSLRTGTFPCTAGTATVTGPGTVTPGGTTTFGVGPSLAGHQVEVWLHSTPILLGRYTVSNVGTVSVTIPSSTATGSHTLVVLAEDGTLVGTKAVTASGAVLAFTGADGAVSLTLVALVLVLAGAALLVARRRRA